MLPEEDPACHNLRYHQESMGSPQRHRVRGSKDFPGPPHFPTHQESPSKTPPDALATQDQEVPAMKAYTVDMNDMIRKASESRRSMRRVASLYQ